MSCPAPSAFISPSWLVGDLYFFWFCLVLGLLLRLILAEHTNRPIRVVLLTPTFSLCSLLDPISPPTACFFVLPCSTSLRTAARSIRRFVPHYCSSCFSRFFIIASCPSFVSTPSSILIFFLLLPSSSSSPASRCLRLVSAPTLPPESLPPLPAPTRPSLLELPAAPTPAPYSRTPRFWPQHAPPPSQPTAPLLRSTSASTPAYSLPRCPQQVSSLSVRVSSTVSDSKRSLVSGSATPHKRSQTAHERHRSAVGWSAWWLERILSHPSAANSQPASLTCKSAVHAQNPQPARVSRCKHNLRSVPRAELYFCWLAQHSIWCLFRACCWLERGLRRKPRKKNALPFAPPLICFVRALSPSSS